MATIAALEEVSEVEDAVLKLKNGHDARVTMHMLEGSKEESRSN